MDSPGQYVRCACGSSSTWWSTIKRKQGVTFYDCRCLDCRAAWRIRSRKPFLVTLHNRKE